ncbi:hypothetical protein B566_EDAN005627 [Ephemera danica]|nr:hypothetical protein B566_EDAN005627 [Ephemera danica]
MKLLTAILLAYFGLLCSTLELSAIPEAKSLMELTLERVNEFAVQEDCVEKQLEMCQRRETDLANTVVTSLRRESDVKAQLQSCEDREKHLNVKLQQFEEGHSQSVDLQNLQNQIKEVSRNLSALQEEIQHLRRESDVKAQLQSCEDREKLLNVKLQQYEEGHAQSANLQNLQNQIKEVSRNLSFCQEEIQQCKIQGQKTENEKNKLQESLKQCTQSLQQLTTGQQTIIRILGESRDELKQEIITPKASLPTVHLATGVYLFLNKLMNWNAARKFCKSNGMDLVSIENEAENTAIFNHAKSLPGWHDAWTSGCYSSSRGAHVWERTGQTAKYFNWADQEPSDRTDGFCILVTNHSQQWWDATKTAHIRAVCEL